jgi:threonine dehydratase
VSVCAGLRRRWKHRRRDALRAHSGRTYSPNPSVPDPSVAGESPHSMTDILLADVQAARRRIGELARPTPVERSEWLSAVAGVDVFLKLECWQRTRSFKIRGASNAVLSLDARARGRGIVAASAGNHGMAVALAARETGIRARIFVPVDAPQTKKSRIRAWGAELDDSEPDYDAAERAAAAFSEARGATLIHAFSDPRVVAGQGTIALELLETLPAVRTVIVPVGGGGLVAGTGAVLKSVDPEIRIIGVQSTETRAMYEALRAGHVVDVPVTPTLADGLAGGTDEASMTRVRAVVDEMLLIPEAAIAPAIHELYVRDGVLAEGSAAVAVAAITEGGAPIDGTTALVVTGGNIDAPRAAAILGRSLHADHRVQR